MDKPDEVIYSSTMDVTKEPVTDLTWLAENLKVWPKKYHDLYKVPFKPDDSRTGSWGGSEWDEINGVTKAEWQATQQSMVEISEELGLYDKPVQQEWDGEGLPPVNVMVECRATGWVSTWTTDEWAETVVTAIGEVMFLSKNSRTDSHEVTGFLVNWEFRPIKSAAELEADKRERWIDKADDIFISNSEDSIGAIYDWLKATNQLSRGKE